MSGMSQTGGQGGGVRPPRFLDFETCLHVLLPCEMWLDQNGRFSYTPLHFVAKKGNWNDMKLFFLLTFGRFLNIPLHLAVKNGKC